MLTMILLRFRVWISNSVTQSKSGWRKMETRVEIYENAHLFSTFYTILWKSAKSYGLDRFLFVAFPLKFVSASDKKNSVLVRLEVCEVLIDPILANIRIA